MAVKKVDSGKRVRNTKNGEFIHKKDAGKTNRTVVIEPTKKDGGGTESTGPKKK